MDSPKSSSSLLFLSICLMLFALASSCCNDCQNTTPNPDPNPDHPSPKLSCPRDALSLSICTDLLGGLIGKVFGHHTDHPCCSALGGLVDVEAAVCLCTALKANVLGINLDIPIALDLLINTCGKNIPNDFTCD